MKKRMNENEVKIRLRDKLAKATLSASTLSSDAKESYAYYDGKATAFAEAIEVIEELEATQ